MTDSIWILLISTLLALICSILSVYVVLHRKPLVVDALSHSAFLGVILSYIAFQSRHGLHVQLFALLTSFILFLTINFISRNNITKFDSAIGIGFTTSFALGIVLISLFARDVDLDCILFGDLLLSPYQRLILFGKDVGAQSFWDLVFFSFVFFIVFIFFARRMFLSSFDIGFSRITRLSRGVDFILLFALVVLLTICFDIVGVLLPLGLLTIPANIALIFSKSHKKMILISIVMGLIPTLLANYLGHIFDIAVSPTMIALLGVEFVIAILISKILKIK